MFMEDFLIDGTNFKISSGIYDILYYDCIYFGFIKNDRPNISGFLNHLIYHLSQYREDLHLDFLKKNNNDSTLALTIEQNIYSVYLKTFDISNDSKKNIQLRINKQYKSTFIKIVDNYLNKYNMDFTNYIRTLLLEYAIKPLYQREYFNIYNYSKIILQAQKQSRLIKIRTNQESICFLPVGIEKFYLNDQFYVFGYTKNKEEIITIKYATIKSVSLLDEKIDLTDNDYKLILEEIDKFFDDLSKMEEN